MKTAIIIQARVGSTRLPGKVLLSLSGKPVLEHIIERCQRAKANTVAVATTRERGDDAIEALCRERGIPCVRGETGDVLSRFFRAAQKLKATTVVRVTGDCPVIAPELIDACLETFSAQNADYASAILPEPRRLMRGLDVEVFSAHALAKAHARSTDPYEREHVTPYIRRNAPKEFTVVPVPVAEAYTRSFRLTLDYPEDFVLLRELYAALAPQGGFFETKDAIAFLEAHPEVAAINCDCVQKP